MSITGLGLLLIVLGVICWVLLSGGIGVLLLVVGLVLLVVGVIGSGRV